MQRIFLMRHGEAFDDVNGTYGGWADDEPTPKALKQAQEKLVELKKLPIERIVCSPLKRAAIPAKIFAEALNLPLEIRDNFKERNAYGFLTGKSKKEAKQKYPELVAKLSDLHFTIENGEPFTHVRERVLHGLREIIASGKNTLIVSHGGAIRTILRELRMPRDENPADFEIIEITKLVHILKN